MDASCCGVLPDLLLRQGCASVHALCVENGQHVLLQADRSEAATTL